MPNPFTTLAELFENALQGHIDGAKIDKILSNQDAILLNQADLLAQQDDLRGQNSVLLMRLLDAQGIAQVIAAKSAEDLLAIKTFLGIPDARILATQDQLDTLGAQLKKETDAVQQFDQTIHEAEQQQT